MAANALPMQVLKLAPAAASVWQEAMLCVASSRCPAKVCAALSTPSQAALLSPALATATVVVATSLAGAVAADAVVASAVVSATSACERAGAAAASAGLAASDAPKLAVPQAQNRTPLVRTISSKAGCGRIGVPLIVLQIPAKCPRSCLLLTKRPKPAPAAGGWDEPTAAETEAG